jgi:hypothetical protein
MPKIVIVEKSGTLKTASVKDFAEETLYKKAGLKSGEGFVLQYTWGTEDGLDQSIKLYAKKTGRAGQENKYDFPPPVDETLFFGPCILVGSDLKTGEVVDLEEEDWEEIYEFLFGGFEDLGSEDSEDEEDVDTDEELEAIQKTTGTVVKQTKQGYAKDGFIVDDDDEESLRSEEESEESDEESEDTPPKKLLVKGRKPAAAKSTTSKPLPVAVQQPQTHMETNLQIEDCESELSEESYD